MPGIHNVMFLNTIYMAIQKIKKTYKLGTY